MNLYAVLLFSVLLCCQTCNIGCQETTDNEKAIAAGSNQFSKKLYKELIGGTENLVVSPFSVEAVLALLLLGLQGSTEKRISQALYLPESRSQWVHGFKSIFKSLQATEDVTIEIANKIYAQKGFDVKESFRNDTEEYFNSVTEEVDISKKAEEVRLAVNNWAAKKTHNKIRDLLAPGSLSDVVMILLNAIYFKGMWKVQFKKEETRNRSFYLSSGSTKDVPMMTLRTHLPYAELFDLDAKVLKLPYKGDKFSMLVVLPNERNGISNLESNLDKLDVNEILRSLSNVEVQVKLPKFTILHEIELNNPLIKIGFGELFTGAGNFSGITDTDIHVSRALQKAFVEVNEEGTEAAAVTALLISPASAVVSYTPREYYFIADHPFLFIIIEEEKGTILFMGRVMNPAKEE